MTSASGPSSSKEVLPIHNVCVVCFYYVRKSVLFKIHAANIEASKFLCFFCCGYGRLFLKISLMLVISYFLDWNARVLLVTSELLAGVVFEGAFYSRARSIPFSLSVTKFFSKRKNPWTISLHNHTILIHHKQNFFIQHTNVRFIY